MALVLAAFRTVVVAVTMCRPFSAKRRNASDPISPAEPVMTATPKSPPMRSRRGNRGSLFA